MGEFYPWLSVGWQCLLQTISFVSQAYAEKHIHFIYTNKMIETDTIPTETKQNENKSDILRRHVLMF